MAAELLAALNALYHHNDSAVKDQASRWLEQWQQTPEAWSISDQLLHNPSSNLEQQVFASQTLRTKASVPLRGAFRGWSSTPPSRAADECRRRCCCALLRPQVQRDFEELPDAAVDSLRDSLVTLLLKFARGAPPVRTQLCLALAALCTHVPAERWGGPNGAPRWFANRFQTFPPETALPCMLELMTVIPQEASSQRVAVHPARRAQYRDELRAALPDVLLILTGCLGAALGDRVREQVLEAFGAWLQLSDGWVGGLSGEALAAHPLVNAALDGLKSTEVFHAAVDAVCELVRVTVEDSDDVDNGGVPRLRQAMLPLVQHIVPAVMALRPRFVVSSRRHTGGSGAGDTDDFDDDEDTAKGMARLFAEVRVSDDAPPAKGARAVRLTCIAALRASCRPSNSARLICWDAVVDEL